MQEKTKNRVMVLPRGSILSVSALPIIAFSMIFHDVAAKLEQLR
jgi:hypothetical protein